MQNKFFLMGALSLRFFASNFKSGCCSVIAALRKSVKCRSVRRERWFDLIASTVEKEFPHTYVDPKQVKIF